MLLVSEQVGRVIRKAVKENKNELPLHRGAGAVRLWVLTGVRDKAMSPPLMCSFCVLGHHLTLNPCSACSAPTPSQF